MQEIIFDVKPDLIIETGVAHGGSLIFYSSMLHLLDLYDSKKENISNERSVLGIDIKIHDHNKEFIQTHPFSDKICLHESSSVCDSIKPFIEQATKGKKSILVVLDSNHTEDHVSKELDLYSHYVSPNSYCVVFDSTIEDMPEEMFSNREWGPGNNPRTAVNKFLSENSDFILDENIDNKPIITAAKGGFLKKLKV
jgi:cephalosporin hydroxylase